MSKKCRAGEDYGCPYLSDCNSDRGIITSVNPNNPLSIYCTSRTWSDATKTWADKTSLYSCQPENLTRQRNMELMLGETFYEQNVKNEKMKVSKDILKGIEELMVKKRLITRS
jgi:hypothetical protein